MSHTSNKAYWYIRLDAICPNCKKEVDLLEYNDFWYYNDIELGQRDHDVDVICPNCEHNFKVDTEY